MELIQSYPPYSLPGAEAALLTAWRSLDRYHDDLVLAGGLAIRYLTKQPVAGLPGAVTMDVDLGIELTASGDQYGTIKIDLAGLGFRWEDKRLVRQHQGTNLYIDFLTENPPATSGSATVDDVTASIIPGVNRALKCYRKVPVKGKDLYGAERECIVKVAEIGPMLVMKLNAFGSRKAPKDAYDILLGVVGYLDGPAKAIEGFYAEGEAGSPAYPTALEVLRRDFCHEDQDGPIRASDFDASNKERIRQDLVTMGQMLLGG